MIKRTLYFGNPSYLSLKNSQLEIRLPEVEKADLPDIIKTKTHRTIPVEDIGVLVIDHRQITITQGLLAALMENNVAVIVCNSTHHPSGLLLALSSNTVQNERYRAQLDATEPLKKQLWQQTVIQKIKNQAALLRSENIETGILPSLYNNIKSGDSENREATAAAYYWKNLSPILSPGKNPGKHGEGEFRRHREGLPPNNYLNYGYAILRATMARSIVAAGLLPTLGIHHHNRYNAYCLADDLMEPYRPFIDKLVIEIIKEHGLNEDIPKEIKVELLKIPVMDVMMDREKNLLMAATQRTAVSIVKCFEGEQRKPVYPEFIRK